MSYVNGKDVLPPGLLEELQGYIQGELLYIPKKAEERVRWGENSGSRQEIAARNEEIFCSHSSGCSVNEPAEEISLIRRKHPQDHFKNAANAAGDEPLVWNGYEF